MSVLQLHTLILSMSHLKAQLVKNKVYFKKNAGNGIPKYLSRPSNKYIRDGELRLTLSDEEEQSCSKTRM